VFPYSLIRYSAEPKVTLTQVKAGFLLEDIDCSKIATWMEKNGVGVMQEGDEIYTHHRHKVPTKPYLMHYQGNLDLLHRPKLGIVGSRKATAYGQQVMQDLFAQLEGTDVVTISGGAEGIDELCHVLSIEKGIPTICVLGGGLAYYLAHARRGLFERIVAWGGLILSEFRLKEQPAPYTFPQRNRIIAGLSDWLFVPCAAAESGSLITVSDAKKARVPVYGVPGSLYEEGQKGVNQGIATGDIHAVYDLKIFVESLWLSGQREKTTQQELMLSPEQERVYIYLQTWDSWLLEHIADALDQSPLDTSMILTEMEMDGLVYEERPGMWKSK
jgi:DNA processing protein